MKRWIIILTLSTTSFCQDISFSDVDTIFLDQNWVKTENRSDAFYYRSIKFNDEDSLVYVEDYYLETKTLQMTGTYLGEMKSEQQSGKFFFYYPDEKIKSEYNFRNGKIHGKVLKYYENGNLQSEETYRNGFRKDTIVNYYENGQLQMIQIINKNYDLSEKSYTKKELILVEAWDIEGNQQVSEGNGTYIEFDDDGKKRLEIQYEKGFPHGEWIRYVPGKRKKACVMTFKEGKFIKGEIYERGKKDVFATLYRAPRYPSGVRGLDHFIEKHTGKCTDAIEGDVEIIINVDRNGEVYFEQVLSGNVNACQLDEIYEMVEKMPKWIPAVNNGFYTESSYVIRIVY